MAHELDFTTGKAAIAYTGNTPWHGLGQQLTPGSDLLTWQQEAGLDWEAKLAHVHYKREITDVDGSLKHVLTSKDDSRVIYRSDSGDALGVVSSKYKPVQPREIIEFYRDLTERWGFQLETAGSLKNGRKIWALARTDCALQLKDNDNVKGFLLLATSFDGSMSTQARFTSVRVVCNNTIEIATQGRPDITVAHNATFDAAKVKNTLQIGDDWAQFRERAVAMSERQVTPEESVRFFMSVYHDITSNDDIRALEGDAKLKASVDRTIARLTGVMFSSPGSHMASARGMLWGVLNAVTFDVDHFKPARNQENRLDSAWFGPGAALKQRAWKAAEAML